MLGGGASLGYPLYRRMTSLQVNTCCTKKACVGPEDDPKKSRSDVSQETSVYRDLVSITSMLSKVHPPLLIWPSSTWGYVTANLNLQVPSLKYEHKTYPHHLMQ